MTTLKVKEVFYTLQGEGLNWGMPSVFVRLGECNLRCTFCDTDFLTSLMIMTPQALADRIIAEAGDCRNIVITGGEPLLQQKELAEVMEILNKIGRWYYCVETNGTVELEYGVPHLRFDWICCSPKVKPSAIKLQMAHEIKVVFTQQYRQWLDEYYEMFPEAQNWSISPEALPDNPYSGRFVQYMLKAYPAHTNVEEVIKYVKENPKWRLNLQTHKVLNIR